MQPELLGLFTYRQPSDCGVSASCVVAKGPTVLMDFGALNPVGLFPSALRKTYVVCTFPAPCSLLLSGVKTLPACSVAALVMAGRALFVWPASCPTATSVVQATDTAAKTFNARLIDF